MNAIATTSSVDGSRAAAWVTIPLGLTLLVVAAAVLLLPLLYDVEWSSAPGVEPFAGQWRRALQVCSAGFGSVLAISVLSRVRAGASPAELLRTRFDETPPVRGLVHLVQAWLLIAWLGAVAALVRAGYVLYRVYSQTGGASTQSVLLVAALVAGALLLSWFGKGFRATFVTRPNVAPPRVEVALAAVDEGIAASDLAHLGAERFPNRVRRTWWIGICARLGLLVALWSAAAAIAGLTLFERDQPTFLALYAPVFRESLEHTLEWAAALAPWQDFALACGWAALVVGLLALTHNRNYLLFSFGSQQIVHATVTVVLAICAALMSAEAGTVALTLSASLFAWGLRLAGDLNLARKHSAWRRAESAMRSRLETHGAVLRALLDDPACHLPEINLGDIQQRITRGAGNLAEADAFVTRHFGRYLRVGQVRKERCAMALLRYMSVDRHVGACGGWPTHKPLGGRTVPMWDEQRFPLNVPAGFVTWLDGLPLAEDWNVVRTCGGCGGCGWVMQTEYYQETEYYTEYVNGQSRSGTRQVQRSRQVQRTCSACNGCGKLEYAQVLYTQWRSMRPSAVHPYMPLPEIVDGAEEACLVRMVLTENRQNLARHVQSVAFLPELMNKVDATADAVRAEHPILAQRALGRLGGQLYRAEYSIWAFHTLQIRFALLARHVGWFFGRRPEFYFPRLPFAWSRLGTTLFLPPLFVTAVAAATLGVWVAVTSISVP